MLRGLPGKQTIESARQARPAFNKLASVATEHVSSHAEGVAADPGVVKGRTAKPRIDFCVVKQGLHDKMRLEKATFEAFMSSSHTRIVQSPSWSRPPRAWTGRWTQT